MNRLITTLTRTALVAGMLSALSACVTYERPSPDDPFYAPPVYSAQEMPQRTEGSLYQTRYGMSLFDDRKALQVGDVITVTLNERTVSRKRSNVSVSKDSDINFNTGPLLGRTLGDMETGVGQSRDFNGDAGADQSNSLEGNITVTVAEVLPNGNLVVRGEKWMTLNRGDEFIRISGIIRPDDVSPQNTVQSNRLAHARISYSGTGTLADAGEMGWLGRFFNSPYWPF